MTAELVQTAINTLGEDIVRPPAGDADRVDGTAPGVVVAPRSAEEVAATLAWASRERLTVVARGAGTKDEWGRSPTHIDISLSLARLNRVIDHSDGDLTATFEAGASLHDVNLALGRHRQQLPIDPPRSKRATIGGILATNDSGPLRHRYGTPSDLVLGVTMATADGLIAKSGGKVVKNVAGYDLGRLLAGSHGTLAVVVAATFKLAPLPEVAGTVAITAAPDVLMQILAAMTDRQLEPTRVEAFAGNDLGPKYETLFVRFESDVRTVQSSISALSAIATTAGSAASVMADPDEPDFWRAFPDRVFSHRTVVRMSWLPADLGDVLGVVDSVLGSTRWALAGRAVVGAGHLGIDGDEDEQKRVIEALQQRTELGHVVVVQAPRSLRSAADVWPTRDSKPVWATLKAAFDPSGILGAGRGPL